eukprot:14326615-Alexandrium_andersonii.AAC.1
MGQPHPYLMTTHPPRNGGETREPLAAAVPIGHQPRQRLQPPPPTPGACEVRQEGQNRLSQA